MAKTDRNMVVFLELLLSKTVDHVHFGGALALLYLVIAR